MSTLKPQLEKKIAMDKAKKVGKPLWKYLIDNKAKATDEQMIYLQGVLDGVAYMDSVVKSTFNEVFRKKGINGNVKPK